MVLFGRNATKVAVVQMWIVPNDRQRNLETAARLLDQCAAAGARLVVLPQSFSTGVNLTDLHALAEPIPTGPTAGFLRRLAAERGLHIVAGALEKDAGGVYDAALVVGPNGDVIGKYRRRFLWGMEKDFMLPGDQAQCVSTSLGRIGLLIGYDLGFPEACRPYFAQRVDLLVCVATIFRAVGAPTATLCRARAAENHCYFLLCSGLGFHEFANSHYMGGSMIVSDPLFEKFVLKRKEEGDLDVLCKAGDRECVLVQQLRIDKMEEHRKNTPQYEDYQVHLGNSSVKFSHDQLVD